MLRHQSGMKTHLRQAHEFAEPGTGERAGDI